MDILARIEGLNRFAPQSIRWRYGQYTPSLKVLQPRQVSDWMVPGDCRYTTIAWLWTRSSRVRPCTPSSATTSMKPLPKFAETMVPPAVSVTCRMLVSIAG